MLLATITYDDQHVLAVAAPAGNSLDNLLQNPALCDLIGGIQAVTLGDEEARRRGTQKTVLERKAPPTFDIIVEIQERDRVAVHRNTSEAVDAILRGIPEATEIRSIDDNDLVTTTSAQPDTDHPERAHRLPSPAAADTPRLYRFGINRSRLEQVAEEMRLSLNITERLSDAGMLVTSKNYFRRRPQRIRDAEAQNLPVYVLKSHPPAQFRQFLGMLSRREP